MGSFLSKWKKCDDTSKLKKSYVGKRTRISYLEISPPHQVSATEAILQDKLSTKNEDANHPIKNPSPGSKELICRDALNDADPDMDCCHHNRRLINLPILSSEERRLRVQNWVDSYNPVEQSYSGLHIGSNQFETVSNSEVPRESNNNLDNDHQGLAKQDFIPVGTLKITWNSKDCNDESRSDPSMNTGPVSVTIIDKDCDADASGNKIEFDLVNKTVTINRKLLEHAKKSGKICVRIGNFCDDPNVKKKLRYIILGIINKSETSQTHIH